MIHVIPFTSTSSNVPYLKGYVTITKINNFKSKHFHTHLPSNESILLNTHVTLRDHKTEE